MAKRVARPATNSMIDRVGQAIYVRRKSLGRTMQDVATEAELSQPFLSQIERGQALPSMRSLDRIAAALGTTGIALLMGDGPAGDVEIVRADERAGRAPTGSDSHVTTMALTSPDRHLLASEMSGGSSDFQDRYVIHRNEELIVVLQGRFEFDVAGEVKLLAPGDALSYSGGIPHRHRLVDDGPHRFLAVIVHEDFDIVGRPDGTVGTATVTIATAAVVATGSCGDVQH